MRHSGEWMEVWLVDESAASWYLMGGRYAGELMSARHAGRLMCTMHAGKQV